MASPTSDHEVTSQGSTEDADSQSPIDLTHEDEVECQGWTLKRTKIIVADSAAVLPTIKANYQDIMRRQAEHVCPKRDHTLRIRLLDTIPVIASLDLPDLVARHKDYWLAYLYTAHKMHKAEWQAANEFGAKITRGVEYEEFAGSYGRATALRMMAARHDIRLAKSLIADLLDP